MDAVERVARLRDTAGHFLQHLRVQLVAHRSYITTHGEDMPEIRDWRWSP
jgi:xylulose-5-phosphate/fructose-6-phosphate phosphoketolase